GGAAITPPLKQQFTAELWVRHEHANSLGGLLGACALNTATNAPGQGWGLCVRNGRFELTVATQNNAQTIAAPDTSPALRWTHVAASYDGAKIRLFLDGAEVSSDDVSGDIAYPAEPLLTLGAWQNKSTNPFHGAVRDVRIWSVARDAQHIKDAMIGPVARGTQGLRHSWRLDEGAPPAGDPNIIVDYGTGNLPLNIAGLTWAEVEPYLPTRPQDMPIPFTLYLVGRNPKTGELYLRTLQNDAGRQPWEKIDLTIPPAYVTPIFAFD